MDKKVFFCVGGDPRYSYMCSRLCGIGKVYCCGIENAAGAFPLAVPEDIPEKADVLVLPMLNEGLAIEACGVTVSFERLAAVVKKGGMVLGGRMRPEQKDFFTEKGFGCEDYFARESLVIKNCIPTAEGALQLALSETSETVFGSRVLILGFGRAAKCCARLFKTVGAVCTVAARRPEALAAAWTEGMDSFDIKDLKCRIGGYDIIINTVPALVLTAEVLSHASRSSLVIDLASRPGGTDFFSAEKLGIKALHALALPGKTAPAAAGRIIAETIEEILCE
ncbi:dipicolinate synthase subunit DpsA [uncultured Ruminococcus sp.]|uniref:dipicolinate synthase subunit DpsA n=1 Tax=uncultured Ruminococcus sp. TaxID=165186 RepID=UPI0025DD23BC|nr:dipicolinate synthase subunit DpsA [uncultured Ruminococcus sp.]